MQGARSAVVVTILGAVLGSIACSSAVSGPPPQPGASPPSASPAPSTPPSTDVHDDVAGNDDGDSPPGEAIGPTGNRGNLKIRRFDDAKKELGRIYASHRIDLYCGCAFLPEAGKGNRVDFATCGVAPAKDASRAARIEWEHAVPASAFGHTFGEWRDGSDRCIDGRGKRYKGRKCARTNAEFSRIEADLHNLFPVVGEVNGLRSDLPMGVLDTPDVSAYKPSRQTFRFGRCATAIEGGVFVPRAEIRGDLARAYKYMDQSYPERRLVNDAHRALFDQWDKADPPDAWERERNRAIAQIQGNANPFIGP